MEQRPLITPTSDIPPPDPGTAADRTLQGPGISRSLSSPGRSHTGSGSWRSTSPAWRVDNTLLPMSSSQAQRDQVTPLKSHSLNHGCCCQAKAHFPPSLACNLDIYMQVSEAMTNSPRQCEPSPSPLTPEPPQLLLPAKAKPFHPACSPQGGRALEQESKHPLPLPALATASKPTQQVTLPPRIRFHSREHTSQTCPGPKTQFLISAHLCLVWPHLSPGLLAPGCTALQVAGLCGRRFPRQACTLGLLDRLLDTSPVGPDTVDGAGLGAAAAGGRAGSPGPCAPAGREGSR